MRMRNFDTWNWNWERREDLKRVNRVSVQENGKIRACRILECYTEWRRPIEMVI